MTQAHDQRLPVLTPAVQLGLLEYLAPDDPPPPGSFVHVPLGPRTVLGVVWDRAGLEAKPVAAEKLRPIKQVLDIPPLPIQTLRFAEWVAGYYLSAPGAVLKMAMSVREALEASPTMTLYAPARPTPKSLRLTPQRQAVLAALEHRPWQTAADAASAAGVSTGVVQGLAKAGGLASRIASVDASYAPPDLDSQNIILSEAQKVAADALWHAKAEGKPLLLDGVTGAGKTEVYFDLLARQLKAQGGQALVLLPEIALTTQWLSRFEKRFGVPPVLWHSGLGIAERRRAWRAILTGQAKVVVGARSALFLPYRDLSLIIVDEEHAPAFKQEDGINYNARDMAVVRANLSEAPVLLASATPSLETVTNAQSGRYVRVDLRERHNDAEMPDITLVDLREAALPSQQWLSSDMRSAVRETIESGHQALLFLNRRGYAPITLCRSCGERIECPQCSAWLVEHRLVGRLQCHHCGFSMPTPKHCPACGAEDSLVPCGPGVERLAEETAEAFPDARLLQVTSDTVGNPHRAADMVGAIESGDVDIIIGTQLVSKGYHFERLTFVGVPDADMGLGGGDLRAAERTFQQMTQVAGRAGRGAAPGRVLLQSYMPAHAVMQALAKGERDAFLDAEAEARVRRGLPPFGRLAAVILSAKKQPDLNDYARELALQAPQMPGVTVLGPAPAPMALLRGRHRVRFLLKAERSVYVPQVMREWVSRVPQSRAVRLSVDIDPYSFL
ncbi:MAG: primosomal protein N' [Sphingomonadales bacterium]